MAQKKNSETTATLPLRVMTVLESTADDMVGGCFVGSVVSCSCGRGREDKTKSNGYSLSLATSSYSTTRSSL